jgi:hypothetical protein
VIHTPVGLSLLSISDVVPQFTVYDRREYTQRIAALYSNDLLCTDGGCDELQRSTPHRPALPFCCVEGKERIGVGKCACIFNVLDTRPTKGVPAAGCGHSPTRTIPREAAAARATMVFHQRIITW